jgi:hypothetical protein
MDYFGEKIIDIQRDVFYFDVYIIDGIVYMLI